jgi:hypothetical protein
MPDLERVQQNTPLTLSQQWSEGGVAVDPGTVTVGILRADGTVLVAAGTSTNGTGTAARTFNLTTTHTGLLDYLTVTWTSTLKGTLISYVEVVGGFLFSIADARAVKPLDNATTYPASKIVEARTLAEQALEDACGVAFVPRYTRQTVTAYGGTTILARWPLVRSLRAATTDGVALTNSELTDVRVLGTGEIYHPGRWINGFASTTIAYEHGHDRPPLRVSRACLLLAKSWLTAGPVDDRATSINTEDGFIALSTPGIRGAVTGIPEVDATIAEYSYRVAVA